MWHRYFLEWGPTTPAWTIWGEYNPSSTGKFSPTPGTTPPPTAFTPPPSPLSNNYGNTLTLATCINAPFPTCFMLVYFYCEGPTITSKEKTTQVLPPSGSQTFIFSDPVVFAPMTHPSPHSAVTPFSTESSLYTAVPDIFTCAPSATYYQGWSNSRRPAPPPPTTLCTVKVDNRWRNIISSDLT